MWLVGWLVGWLGWLVGLVGWGRTRHVNERTGTRHATCAWPRLFDVLSICVCDCQAVAALHHATQHMQKQPNKTRPTQKTDGQDKYAHALVTGGWMDGWMYRVSKDGELTHST